ncbi:NUDIX domain-containing protein [Arcicella rosea]|uniref:ADP-ribose pyrophosphatase YjhB (NUDIX family) n=1 Tax=Arcicella rosea TaxID=502909 RepID=A0A841EFQ5_9BACT|nr:NUDIX hydrolase [Arcicella rosea]MBB6001975.1 ADP-ribose pyrophosphatase YjhB (NUDIX family) [Arcicella rosea]
MKVRPSVAIIENEKVLLMRYRYGDTDVFNLPGGNVDAGETLTDTLIRELQEELGIQIAVGAMLVAGEVILPQQKTDVLHCVFKASIIAGIPALNAKETSALEVLWQPITSLNQLAMYPNVGDDLQVILSENKGFEYLGRLDQVWY